MNWISGFFLILITVYLIDIQLHKKKQRKLRKALAEDWGKTRQNNYLDFSLIDSFFRNHKTRTKVHQTISDTTWSDLDLNEIFKFLDRSTSKIGQQYLYYRLRTITSISEVKQFQKLTNIFYTSEILRIKSQVELSRLSSHKAYFLEELFRPEKVEKSNKYWLFLVLAISPVLFIVLSIFNPLWSLLLIPIFSINLVFHYKNKSSLEYYLNGVGQLAAAYKTAQNLSTYKEIQHHYKDFRFLKNVKTIISRTRFLEWEKKLDNELALLFWFISEITKITFNLEPLLFYSFQSALENKKRDLEHLYRFLGEVDAAISCASLHHADVKICSPEFSDKKEILAEAIHHPLIENCVSNNLELNNSSLLLTGSNMSGKTTFIRTVSIDAILAQTLGFCFAARFKAPFFKIYSSIRISDDLMNNTSYYLEEVVRIKELVDISEKNEPCLFVLDELLKGTNTAERIAAGKAILSYLNKGNHVVMVSTHDLELTDLLQKRHYDLYHFTEQIENNQLHFDYKIKPGRPEKGNAIKILELYNFPSELLADSRKGNQNHLANFDGIRE